MAAPCAPCTTSSDPTICHPCTPVTDCFNDCGRCELCLGKTTLPPECFPDGGTGGSGGIGGGGSPGERCDDDLAPCGCPATTVPHRYYCITGCCIELPT